MLCINLVCHCDKAAAASTLSMTASIPCRRAKMRPPSTFSTITGTPPPPAHTVTKPASRSTYTQAAEVQSRRDNIESVIHTFMTMAGGCFQVYRRKPTHGECTGTESLCITVSLLRRAPLVEINTFHTACLGQWLFHMIRTIGRCGMDHTIVDDTQARLLTP